MNGGSSKTVWVQKYGGTSVGSPERISRVADQIHHTKKQHSVGLVVVVSAMGQTTDELIELAHQVSQDPPGREMDMLLTAGERISMALLSMALADRGVEAISLTGSQSGIITDSAHRRARIQKVLGNRIREGVSRGQVVIVAGFQGVSTTKEITTLGRGGSDTTAVALAAALGAQRCEIYTDVDGVFSADPRLVPEARFCPELPHSVMVELATRGAGVLHPRSVELAARYGVPIWVKNALRSSVGTYIGKKGELPTAMQPVSLTDAVNETVNEEMQVRGATADRDKFLVTIELARPGAAHAVYDFSAQQHLQILASSLMGTRLQFFSEKEAQAEWRRGLEKLAADGFIRSYQLELDQVPLSIVGAKFAQDGQALGLVLSTLTREGIEPRFCTSSALAITIAVPETHVGEGLRAIHSQWVLGS